MKKHSVEIVVGPTIEVCNRHSPTAAFSPEGVVRVSMGDETAVVHFKMHSNNSLQETLQIPAEVTTDTLDAKLALT